MKNTFYVTLLFSVVASAVFAPAVACADILDGLISYWPMEETTGVVTNDLAMGLNGLIEGNPQRVTGIIGGALDCDGDGDYVSAGFSELLMPAEEISIQAWVNVNEFNAYAAIIGNIYDRGLSEGGYWLGTYGGGYFGWAVTTDGSIDEYYWTDAIYETGIWYHLVATYKSGEMRLWVDGSLDNGTGISISSVTGNIDYSLAPDYGFLMGRYWDMGPKDQGTTEEGELLEQAVILDEVALWDRALSDEEVAVLYNGGMGKALTLVIAPNPTVNAELVPVDSSLSWKAREGVEVSGFNVYFGTDPDEQNPEWFGNNKVIDAENITSYSPQMDFERTYYWRVDVLEPNSLGDGMIIHKGLTWSFTTAPRVPIVTSEPENVTVAIGDTGEFVMEGVNAAAYQWFKLGNPQDVKLTNDANITGTNTATLVIDDVRIADEGYYYCVISNGVLNTQTSPGRLLTERLILHLPLEGNVDDQSPSDIDCVVAGDPNWIPGVNGQGLQLFADEQVNDHIVMGSADDLIVDDADFSVALWVQSTGSPTMGALISNRNFDSPDNAGWGLSDDGGIMDWNISDGSVSHDIGFMAVNDGLWHHICVTNDRDGFAFVYVDAQPVAVADISDTSGPVDGGFAVRLGLDGQGNYPFTGSFDDVRIYSYVLTHYDVARLYTDLVADAEVCLGKPEFDLDGNCRVDLADIAIVARAWLNCKRVPSCLP